MAEHLLAEISLGPRDVLRVTREGAHGHAVVKLRRWFIAASGEMRPGRDGVSFAATAADALAAALGSLRKGKA